MISSRLGYLFKIILILYSIFFSIISIYFLIKEVYIASLILICAAILLMFFSRKIKIIKILSNEHLEIKGFVKKIVVKRDDVQRVGNIFLFFFIQIENKRYFYLNKLEDQLLALTKGTEIVEKNTLNLIKNRNGGRVNYCY